MADIARKLGFGSQEQHASPEWKQMLAGYFADVDDSFMNRLRVSAYQVDPTMILEEDGIAPPPTPVQKSPAISRDEFDASKGANNLVYLLTEKERQAAWVQQQRIEEARRQAKREAA